MIAQITIVPGAFMLAFPVLFETTSGSKADVTKLTVIQADTLRFVDAIPNFQQIGPHRCIIESDGFTPAVVTVHAESVNAAIGETVTAVTYQAAIFNRAAGISNASADKFNATAVFFQAAVIIVKTAAVIVRATAASVPAAVIARDTAVRVPAAVIDVALHACVRLLLDGTSWSVFN